MTWTWKSCTACFHFTCWKRCSPSSVQTALPSHDFMHLGWTLTNIARPLTLTPLLLLCKSLDSISLWLLVFTVQVWREHSSHSASTLDSWPPFTPCSLLPRWVTRCLIPCSLLAFFHQGFPCIVRKTKGNSSACLSPSNDSAACTIINRRAQLRAGVLCGLARHKWSLK